MRIKDARQTFLGIWIRNLLEKKPIHVYGNGLQRRDYNYVDDVVDALLIAATRPEARGKIYNLGAPEPLSLEDTARLMCKLSEEPHMKDSIPGRTQGDRRRRLVCDYKQLQSTFDWDPKVTSKEFQNP